MNILNDGKSRKIKYVLFDLGNTLIYFDGDWKEVLTRAIMQMVGHITELGYKIGEGTFASQFMELLQRYYLQRETNFRETRTSSLLKKLLNDLEYKRIPISEIDQILDTFHKVTEAHWHLEEDTQPLLEALKSAQYHQGIISNAGDEANANRLIDNAKIRDYFEPIVISADLGFRKPAPHIFQEALAYWGADPDEAIMVGDTFEADIVGARNFGMKSIWITRRVNQTAINGSARKDIADYQVKTLKEIAHLLGKINAGLD